jgi:glycosyltransferase involved in cell wall biosynthesis
VRLLSIIHGPEFGGAHNNLLRLSQPLAERGIETVAVLPNEADSAAHRFEAADIETHCISLGRLRATANPVAQARFGAALPGDVRRLADLVSNCGAEIVQVHGPTNPQGAFAARRRPGTAVVWQLLDTRAPMILRRLTMPLVVRLADAVTCYGRELARTHPGADRLGERLVFVLPPVDIEALAPSASLRDEARRRLAIPDDSIAVGNLAVRNPQKGIEWLVRAAAEVRSGHPQVVFRAIGTSSGAHDSYERRLREEAAALGLRPPDLEFVDPGEDAHLLLHGLDVFVLTSVPRSEGTPTVILEAMAAGLPAVATDVGAVAEIVTDGVTGRLVPAEDSGAIATGVVELVDSEAKRRSFGSEARRWAEQRLGLGPLADLHARVYRDAAKRAQARTGGQTQDQRQ